MLDCAMIRVRLLALFLLAIACSPAPVAPAVAPVAVAPAAPSAAAPAEAPAQPAPVEISWRPLSPGLDFAEIPLPVPSRVGDSVLRVARIDPAVLDLSLQMASASGGRPRSVDAWLDATGGVAVINAAMYATDFVSSVGWMSKGEHVNHGGWSKDQNSLLALDPNKADLPAFHLFNIGCESRADAENSYGTRVQSIRMMGCAGENLWSEQPREWSSAIIGEDSAGRALFLHVRSPYSMHALVDQLISLPLQLRALHYCEGGPEASLAVRSPTLSQTWVGSWETGFLERDDNNLAMDLPNVIVATPKPAPEPAAEP